MVTEVKVSPTYEALIGRAIDLEVPAGITMLSMRSVSIELLDQRMFRVASAFANANVEIEIVFLVGTKSKNKLGGILPSK